MPILGHNTLMDRCPLKLFGSCVALLIVLCFTTSGSSEDLKAAARAFATSKFKQVLQFIPQPESNSFDAEIELLRGRTLLELNRFAEAQKTLEGLYKQLPHLKDFVYFHLGEAYFGQGKYKQAANYYRSAVLQKNSHWIDRAREQYAASLCLGPSPRLGIKSYKDILRTYPDHPRRPQIELALARCLKRAGFLSQAAAAFQTIWIRYAYSPAAEEANQELHQFKHTRFRPRQVSFPSLMQRIRNLISEKQYKKAEAELLGLLKRRDVARNKTYETQAELELARLYIKLEDYSKAHSLIKTHSLSNVPGGKYLLVTCLARTGQVENAVALYLNNVPVEKAPRGALIAAANLYATYGMYEKALAHYEQATAKLHKGYRRRFLPKLAWLAYRAKKYDLAIERYQALVPRSRGEMRSYYLYWMARAHEEAGHKTEAENLYAQIVEKSLRSYYGILARSRLLELGSVAFAEKDEKAPISESGLVFSPLGVNDVFKHYKKLFLTLQNYYELKTQTRQLEQEKFDLSLSACSADELPIERKPFNDPKIMKLLDHLITRYGLYYPSLQRVKTLWKTGMLEEARRELRLIAMDYAWVRSRGRLKNYRLRSEAERFFTGGPVHRRRWTIRENKIIKEGSTLGLLMAELMDRVGIFDFAFRFKPRNPDHMRQIYPRGFPNLVMKTATKYKLDPNLIWSIMKTESSFRVDAISRVGARGLMQIMPTTARLIEKESDVEKFHVNRLFEPEVSLEMAGWYLKALVRKFKGQLMLVAAAYNGGPHNVARWLTQRGRSAELDEFIEEIPYAESRRYAKKIIRLMSLYERMYCGKDVRVAANHLNVKFEEFPHF